MSMDTGDAEEAYSAEWLDSKGISHHYTRVLG